jgi:hypothetical protein
MARDTTKDLQRLAQELATLEPSERARVMADAARHDRPEPRSAELTLPVLKGGTAWIGGDLRREELYGDDGR